jgi:hypothetical protein
MNSFTKFLKNLSFKSFTNSTTIIIGNEAGDMDSIILLLKRYLYESNLCILFTKKL